MESEGAVGVVEVSEALARRPVLVLRRVRVVLRVPVPGELQENGERKFVKTQYSNHTETPVVQSG